MHIHLSFLNLSVFWYWDSISSPTFTVRAGRYNLEIDRKYHLKIFEHELYFMGNSITYYVPWGEYYGGGLKFHLFKMRL